MKEHSENISQIARLNPEQSLNLIAEALENEFIPESFPALLKDILNKMQCRESYAFLNSFNHFIPFSAGCSTLAALGRYSAPNIPE